MAPNVCIICSIRINLRPSVSDPLSFVECSKCNQYCHTSCAGLKKEEVEFMLETKRSWYCKYCDDLEKSVRYCSPPNSNDSSINATVLKSLTDINVKLEAQNKQFHELIIGMENRVKLLEDVCSQMNIIKKENNDLKKNLNNLEVKLCNMDQKLRATTIDITAIPYNENEKPDDLVLNLFKIGLNLNISRGDIVDCFRVKPKAINNENTNYSPAIIVKFAKLSTKINIFSQKSKLSMNLNTKKLFDTNISKPIFINENLCKDRRILLNAALNVKRERDYKFVWTRGGTIHMKKAKTSPVQIINSFDDLYNLS